MKTKARQMLMQFLALLFAVTVVYAQPAHAQTVYSDAELDQMLAPVALYPDGLLSQVLMASTFPSEVSEAAGWVNAHPGYKGDAAVRAAANIQWDLSVKSLLPFPQLLNTMASNIEWTERLGSAFIGQQSQVMDTVQRLRHRAMEAGYLVSDSRIRVTVQDQLISIYPVKPTVVYVPYYNPTVVYGSWAYPAYAPVYWDPWPGYVSSNRGWIWAAGTVVGVGLLYGAFDWHHHHVREYHNHHYYDRHWGYRDRYRGASGPRTWVRDSRKPAPVFHARPAGTRFTGGRLSSTRIAPTAPVRTMTTRTAPTGTTAPTRTMTTRAAPTGTTAIRSTNTVSGAKQTSVRRTQQKRDSRKAQSSTRQATQRQQSGSRPQQAKPQPSKPQPIKRERHD